MRTFVGAMINFKESKVHLNIRNNVLSALKEFRIFAEQVRQAMDIMLSEVFNIGEEICNKYIWYARPQGSLDEQMPKTGEELRRAYQSYSNMQQITGGELPQKLIYELLEYKVLVAQLLPRLKEIIDTAALFGIYPQQEREYKFVSNSFDPLITSFQNLFQFG